MENDQLAAALASYRRTLLLLKFLKAVDGPTQTAHEATNHKLTALFSRELHHWLRQLYPGAGAMALILFGKTADPNVAADQFYSLLTPDPRALAGLAQTLEELYVAGYLGGVHHARPHVPDLPADIASALTGFTFDQPLGTTQAALVGGPGLSTLVFEARGLAQNLAMTMANRLADALFRAERDKWTHRQLADELRHIETSHVQSDLTATTEGARAQIAAEVDAYTLAGAAWFDVETDTDPCPVCAAIAATNPHPMGAAAPPFHPNCRCSIRPAVSREATA